MNISLSIWKNETTSSSILLKLDFSKKDGERLRDMFFQGYLVFYVSNRTGLMENVTANTISTLVRVENLIPFTLYTFRLQPYTLTSVGRFSNSENGTTAEGGITHRLIKQTAANRMRSL